MHEGWWLASDGRWYPPELHPDAAAATSVTPEVASTYPAAGVDWAAPGAPTQQEQPAPPSGAWGQQGQQQSQYPGSGYPQPRQWGQGQFHRPMGHAAPPKWVPPTAVERPVRDGSWGRAIFGGLSVFFWVAPIYWAYGSLFESFRRSGFHPQVTAFGKFIAVAIAITGMSIAAMLLMHMATDRKRQMGGGVIFASTLIGLSWYFFATGMGEHSPFFPHGYMPWGLGVGLAAFLFSFLRLSSKRVVTRRTKMPEAISYIVPPIALILGLLCLFATGASEKWFTSNSQQSSVSTTWAPPPSTPGESDENTGATSRDGSTTAGVMSDEQIVEPEEPPRPGLNNVLEFHSIQPISNRSSPEQQVVYFDSLRSALFLNRDNFCHAYAVVAHDTPELEHSTYEALEAQLLFYSASYHWVRDNTEDDELAQKSTEAIDLINKMLQPSYIWNTIGFTDESLSHVEQVDLNNSVSTTIRQYNSIVHWFEHSQLWGHDVDMQYGRQCEQ